MQNFDKQSQSVELKEITLKKQLCLQAFTNKRYNECVALCIEILSTNHFDVEIWNLAGLVMLELKDYTHAIEYLSKGLSLARGNLAELQQNAPKVLNKEDKEQDDTSTQNAQKDTTQDEDIKAQNIKAMHAIEQDSEHKADLMNDLKSHNLAIKVAYSLCEGLWLNLAEAHRRAQMPEQAVEILKLGLQEMPEFQKNATWHFNLAKAYVDNEDALSSIEHYKIALQLDPNDLGAMFNLANAQVSLSRFPEAIELYQMAYQRGFKQAGINLANTYIKIGLFTDAIDIFKEIQKDFENDAVFYFNYANALNYANIEFEEAKKYYLRAIALDSSNIDFVINYAHFLLKKDQFKEGFMVYEARKGKKDMLPDLPNLYNGGGQNSVDFTKKVVLVYYEQGFGDCIMFGRFLCDIANNAKEVIFFVKEPLVKLFSDIFDGDFGAKVMVISNLSDIDLNRVDISISLLSLPLALQIKTKQSVGQNAHYLAYKSEVKKALARGSLEETPHDGLKIGVCFSTDSEFLESSLKNTEPKPLFAMLREIFPTQEIFCLNHAGVDGEICERFSLHDCKEEMSDFYATRQIIENLDVVISIDTALAHLSASMGKSTLVLLNKRYDWRYGNGVKSVWYPNVLGFPQSEMGKWESVLANLKSYLLSAYSEFADTSATIQDSKTSEIAQEQVD